MECSNIKSSTNFKKEERRDVGEKAKTAFKKEKRRDMGENGKTAFRKRIRRGMEEFLHVWFYPSVT